MTANMLMEKTLSVSAIKEGTVIDHIDAGQALPLIRHLKFASTGMKITVGLNLKSKSMGLKDLIKLEDLFLSEIEASQIAVFAPSATVNVIEDYRVAKKFRVSLPEQIVGLLVCPNPSCITHLEPITSLFKVEENHQHVCLRCSYCEKTFHLQMNRTQSDD